MHAKGLPAPVQLCAMLWMAETKPTKKQKGKTTQTISPSHTLVNTETLPQSPFTQVLLP